MTQDQGKASAISAAETTTSAAPATRNNKQRRIRHSFDAYYSQYRVLMERIAITDENNSTDVSQCADILTLMRREAIQLRDREEQDERLQRVQVYESTLQAVVERHIRQLNKKIDSSFTESPAWLESSISHQPAASSTDDGVVVARQNDTLERARRVLADTESTAASTLSSLAQQRESMSTQSGRLTELGGMHQHARGMLDNMNKPWWRRKW